MSIPHKRRLAPGRGKSGTRKGKANRAMLDLTSVKSQIDRMVVDERSVQENYQEKLARAQKELKRWGPGWEELAVKLERSRTSWLLPLIGDPLNSSYPCPQRPEYISVAATDGSQIFPDRHEISSCYLINIGYILLHYGTGEKPLMSSRPTLYYSEEDTYEEWGGRKVFANRELVGFKRGLMEFTELAELALAAHEEGHPVLALSDGTLILWNLEGKPQDFKEMHLNATLQAMEELRQARVPVAGYISLPGSKEIVNALKVGLCPQPVSDCDHCPYEKDNQLGLDPDEVAALKSQMWRGRALPCAPVEGLGDAALLRQTLKPGERSGLCQSTSKILDEYGPHRIYFFYVNVGNELGRVEIPEWVAEDSELLDLVHACVCDQAEKGQGYPVALAEAHERAVVRGGDRDAFYRFLRDMFVKNDIKARVSTKSYKKRHVGI
ncbi:MAG: hypothetical protein GKR89_31175 [Candidatus Latescibacteria bacterium]|nr:hypothetical protein [Candidatus Latescibacterota bacterium]